MTYTPPPHGPVYCDTYVANTDIPHMWLGMHEPVNTISNAAILIAAYVAYRYVRRSRVGFSGDLILLLFLLAWVGIGSALWHGLRTMWALQLDWIPGVLYLLVLTVLWIRNMFAGRLAGWAAGIGGMFAMVAVSVLGVLTWGRALAQITPNFIGVPMFLTVTVFGIIMVTLSARKFGGEAAVLGASILVAGIVAAIARSVDLLVCQYIPFGTHFLWHIGLSTAACLGLLLIVRMKTVRKAAGVA